MIKFETVDDRTWVHQLLQQQVLTVDFTKKNGERRLMSCTLKEGLIPKEMLPKSDKEQKKNLLEEKVCAVYDINAKGWRSFTWDNVKEIHYGEVNND